MKVQIGGLLFRMLGPLCLFLIPSFHSRLSLMTLIIIRGCQFIPAAHISRAHPRPILLRRAFTVSLSSPATSSCVLLFITRPPPPHPRLVVAHSPASSAHLSQKSHQPPPPQCLGSVGDSSCFYSEHMPLNQDFLMRHIITYPLL